MVLAKFVSKSCTVTLHASGLLMVIGEPTSQEHALFSRCVNFWESSKDLTVDTRSIMVIDAISECMVLVETDSLTTHELEFDGKPDVVTPM